MIKSMRIIGKTNDGFILDASKNDVAALEGLYSHEKRFEVGDVIDIHGLFSKYSSIRSALRDINKLKESAQKIIDSAEWVKEFSES